MAIACPLDLDLVRLRAEVRAMYSRVATGPDGQFHFHRGPTCAVTVLGYDPHEVGKLPPEVTASFAGVGNPHAIAPIGEGEIVLDIGCGAGTDLLLAARRVGSGGRAIGVDMTDGMVARAQAGACDMNLAHVDVRQGDATALPVADAAVSRVISNGVLNLVPEKLAAFSELFRVLRPGGHLQIADIVIGTELPESSRRDVELWTG